jgi:predicted transcriptional regulator of viral defense system
MLFARQPETEDPPVFVTAVTPVYCSKYYDCIYSEVLTKTRCITKCYTLRMPTAAYRALFSLAENQMGYVTTAQATTVRVSPMTLVMMTKRGALERVSRGVYRLINFPVQPLALYMQATLWPYERSGILSHETALSLYELSDTDAARVNITIPANFRVQRKIPDYLIVHRCDVALEETTRLKGMPITTPTRTIRDCIGAHLVSGVITRAISRARRAGMIGSTVASKLERELRLMRRGTSEETNSPTRTASRVRRGGTRHDSEAKTM